MERRGAFVGRARELAELEAGLGDAVEGRGRLFLISGEPGIGKTRLADELADHAAARGLRVLWGRCWEGDGAPAIWPWIQVVRALAATTEAAVLRSQVGAGAPYLSQLVPEIGGEFSAAPPFTSPESARFYLFDAVTTLLKRASAREPVMLVLDDFHAADLPSLRLLQFVARDLREARLLVFVTYRESEMQTRATAGEIFADLVRQGRAVHLQGLSEPDVARLIEGTNGAVPTARLVSAVHGTTEGNPFFIQEMLHHLVESGAIVEHEGRWTTDLPPDALGLPAAVRDVVGQRLARLGEACNRVLTLAAVIGREFSVDALERVSDLDDTQVLQAVEEAVAAGLVREMPRAVGRYVFSHALVRETLHGALTSTHRVRLHRQIGEVLEGLYAPHPEPHLSELAYHFHEAAPGGDVARAVEYARRAAERATASLAFEEAARLYRLAVQTLENHAPADKRLRCELLLAQGEAETRAGGLGGATDTFQRAADVARELGAPEQFARAALGSGGRFVWAIGASDDRLIALLEESRRMLGEEDSVLRVRVLARLATALCGRVLYWRDSLDRSDSLSRQAMEMARRLGDAAVLAYALDARYFALFGPDFVDERLAIATEMVRLAEKIGDREREHQAHHWRMLALLQLGDVPAADVEIAAQARLADELRQPAQRWYTGVVRAMRTLLEGNFAEGERLAEEAMTLGQARYPGRLVILGAQRFVSRWQLGRLHEVESGVKRYLERYPSAHFARANVALLYSELGAEADARREFERAAANDFADLPRDPIWLWLMTNFAEVCVFLGDRARAKILYEMLRPYADRNVVTTAYVCCGSVSRSLGLLAGVMRRWEDAARHFDDAVGMNTRMGAQPWLARTQHDYAAMLVARGAPSDGERARALLIEARNTSQALGMKSLLDKVELLERQLVTAPAIEQDRHVFRRQGDFWTIAYQGRSFSVRDTKGLQYIARLLGDPGRQVHCMELSGDEKGPSAADRRRLQELQADLDEADTRHDLGQAIRRRAERDLLLAKLAGDTGVNPQSTAATRARERARVNVTRTIKDAIARIRKHDVALARHLALAVHTGAWCSYAPDTMVRWLL